MKDLTVIASGRELGAYEEKELPTAEITAIAEAPSGGRLALTLSAGNLDRIRLVDAGSLSVDPGARFAPPHGVGGASVLVDPARPCATPAAAFDALDEHVWIARPSGTGVPSLLDGRLSALAFTDFRRGVVSITLTEREHRSHRHPAAVDERRFMGEGIRIIASPELLREVLAAPGTLTRRGLSSEDERDVALGCEVAAALGRADVGQSVVTRKGHVIAVEAAEGTDACIRRTGELAREGIMVVKRAKPKQDSRFDLPAIEPKTIEAIAAVKRAGLAVGAEQEVKVLSGPDGGIPTPKSLRSEVARPVGA